MRTKVELDKAPPIRRWLLRNHQNLYSHTPIPIPISAFGVLLQRKLHPALARTFGVLSGLELSRDLFSIGNVILANPFKLETCPGGLTWEEGCKALLACSASRVQRQ
jgi:hypothetical protein